MNLARLLLRGSVTGVAEQLVRALTALALTPVMVSKLGLADFGAWVLLTGLFSQFSLLDPGLQSSLPRFLVQREPGRHRGVASTAQFIYLLVTAACIGLTLAVWVLLPWFTVETAHLSTARHITILLGAATAAGALFRLPALHLQSLMRRDLIALIATGRVLVCAAAVFWLLQWRGGGLLQVALVHASGAIVESLLLAWFGRSLGSSLRWRWVDRAVARELLGFSGWAYVISVCDRLRPGLDAFVLGWLRGSPATGVYNLGARPVWMMADVVYAAIGLQLLPAFTRMRESGDQERLHTAFLLITRLSAWLAMAAAGAALALGPSFLRWWVPEHAAEAAPVLLCLALPLGLQLAQVPAVHLLYAVAQHRALALVQSGGMILNLALSLVLSRWLGIVGAALGTAVEIILLHGFVMPLLLARKAGIPAAAFMWRGQMVPLLASMAACSLPALAVWRWMPAGADLRTVAAAGVLTCIWLGLCAWGFRAGRGEITRLRQLLR